MTPPTARLPTIGLPRSLNSSTQPPNKATTPAGAALFPDLASSPAGGTTNDLDMILDIPVQLTVEFGTHASMPIKNLLQLAQGSVVELAGLAGEPLDVLINGFLIAQGEVVVVNDKLGIRLTDIITPSRAHCAASTNSS